MKRILADVSGFLKGMIIFEDNKFDMTNNQFEKLLLQQESSILDFKRSQYDFSNDNDNRKTAEFVKDIISFSNTIRTDRSYIILGVNANIDGTKELLGLDVHIDDSVLQQKIKDKVFPIPQFSYYTFEYSDRIFGIIEIPVKKYEIPISPIIKLKGLDTGKFYLRRGSSNAEANGHESISILKWLDSLSTDAKQSSMFDELGEIMIRLTQKTQLLSSSISEVLFLSKKYDLIDLSSFCVSELSGYNLELTNFEIDNIYSYRNNNAVCTYHELQPPPYNWNPTELINEVKEMDEVYVEKLFFYQSIIEIESIINRLSEKPSIYTQKITGGKFSGEYKYKDRAVNIYVVKDNFENLYNNIRQKLIDKLLAIK
jgi:hypothetical protein